MPVKGNDVSTHNDAPATDIVTNFNKMKLADSNFVYIKATQGDFQDADLIPHWTNSKNILVRGLYHYYDWNYSLQTNVETFSNAIINYPTELPPVLDYESWTNAPTREIAVQTCLSFLQQIKARTGLTPMIYTSPNYWNNFGSNNTEFAKYLLWIAHYTDADKPIVPAPWTKWTFWQYSSTGDGKTYGVESQYIDLNRFNGTIDELNLLAGVVKPPEEVALFKAKVTASVLNVRSGPAITYPIIGSLVLGQIVSVFEEKYGFYRIGIGRWASAAYLKKEDLPVELPPPAIIPDVLFYPLEEGKHYITQVFGVNPQWYPTSRGHNGIDWGIPVGNPIYAMNDGVVITAVAQTTGYGRHVRIQHSNGISIYGHLSSLLVSVGQYVTAKQRIGLSGGATSDPYSGNSTGPHLHAEFRPSVFPPPAPGSYVYGAIDIMPLLASHSYNGISKPVLFRAKVTAYILNTRYGPGTNFYTNGQVTQNTILNVYEERNGWFKISNKNETWCAGWYTEKINDPVFIINMPIIGR